MLGHLTLIAIFDNQSRRICRLCLHKNRAYIYVSPNTAVCNKIIVASIPHIAMCNAFLLLTTDFFILL